MAGEQDVLRAAVQAFSETVKLKLQQFYRVIPKGSNPAVTGEFVEAVVRAFVRKWIAPCRPVPRFLPQSRSNTWPKKASP